MTPGSADERRSARSKVMLTATIESAGDRREVRIDDLSTLGARVLADAFPAPDTPVIFRCKGVTAEGFVAWVRPPLAGIGFDEPIATEDALRKVRSACRAIRKEYRRPGLQAQELTPAERQMTEQWAKRPRSHLGED